MTHIDISYRKASLIPEDVQVHNASSSEIRDAVYSIVQDSIEDDEVDVTQHDLEILVENEISHWSNRPIEVGAILV